MKLLLIIFCVCIILGLIGCGGVALKEVIKGISGTNVNFAIYTDEANLEDTDLILEVLGRMNREMITGVSFHIFRQNDPHLGKAWDGRQAGAHFCIPFLRRICISVTSIDSRTIFHEMGHLHRARLIANGSNFISDWSRVAGRVYIRDLNLPNNEGILTAYSRGNSNEDVAEWVMECYSYLIYGSNYVITGNSEVKKDERYRKKLALLYKYGFLNAKDYKQLKPLFE